MPWSFRKRVKIAPGTTANVGKRGLTSIRFGRRGVGVTVGKEETRAGASLPGTGLSYSTRVGGRRGPSRPWTSWTIRVVAVLLVVIGILVLLARFT